MREDRRGEGEEGDGQRGGGFAEVTARPEINHHAGEHEKRQDAGAIEQQAAAHAGILIKLGYAVAHHIAGVRGTDAGQKRTEGGGGAGQRRVLGLQLIGMAGEIFDAAGQVGGLIVGDADLRPGGENARGRNGDQPGSKGERAHDSHNRSMQG